MSTSSSEPYDENNLEHQEPVQGVSQWQEYNDADGSFANAIERDLSDTPLTDAEERRMADAGCPRIVTADFARERVGNEARAENTRLRAALAMSDQPCAYCSLPAEEMAKCASGFPGCARADDAMGCPHLGAAIELAELKKCQNKLVSRVNKLEGIIKEIILWYDIEEGHPTHSQFKRAINIARQSLE